MLNKFILALLLALCCCFTSIAQKRKSSKKKVPTTVVTDSVAVTSTVIDPLRPAKATFFSAIIPGLGQAYNKKYWKIPIVYGALGTGIYFFITNNREYNRYRDAFKSRLAGFTNDEFFLDAQGNQLDEPRISDEGLIRAQRIFRRNTEVALLVTAGLYVLNIIDANVDAHLLQYNINENLTLAPHYELNQLDRRSTIGLTFNLNF